MTDNPETARRPRRAHTSIRLDADVAEWLDARCAAIDCTRSKAINDVLRGYMTGKIKGPSRESL